MADASQYSAVLRQQHISLGVEERSAAIWHAVTAAAASVDGQVERRPPSRCSLRQRSGAASARSSPCLLQACV